MMMPLVGRITLLVVMLSALHVCKDFLPATLFMMLIKFCLLYGFTSIRERCSRARIVFGIVFIRPTGEELMHKENA